MTVIQPYSRRSSGIELENALKAAQLPISPVTAGLEMERFILNADGTLPDTIQHDCLYKSLHRKLADKVSVEPGAHMIEIKTHPHTDAAALSKDLLKTLAIENVK